MGIGPVTVLMTLGNRKFYSHLKYKTQLRVPAPLTCFTLRISSLLSRPAQLAVLKGRGRCGPSLLPTPHTLPPSWVTDLNAIEARRHCCVLRPLRPGGTAVCSSRTPSDHTFQNPDRPLLLQAEDPPAHYRQCFSSRSLGLSRDPPSFPPARTYKRALASPQTADVLTCPTSPAAAGLWLQPLKARRSGSIKEHMSEGTTNVPLTGWGEWQARPPKNPLPKSCLISCNQPCYPSVWRLDPTVLGQRLWAPASRPTPVTASPVTASRCPAARLCGTVPSRLPVWLPDPTRPCFPSAP